MKLLSGILLISLMLPQARGEQASSINQCFNSREPAQCELKAGVQAYANARYQEAISHFTAALQFDPRLAKAHLYLATAYANQFIPGADTPENIQAGVQAIREFQTAAEEGGNDGVIARHGIASLNFQMKKFEEAKEEFRKIIEIDPKDVEAYYTIAVIDWTLSYQARMKEREKEGVGQEEPLMVGPCQVLAGEHMAEVDEGMQMLTKALELRPDYDDAMAYMNLVYRERADYQCSDAAARERDLKMADKWVDATLDVKKTKQERKIPVEPNPSASPH